MSVFSQFYLAKGQAQPKANPSILEQVGAVIPVDIHVPQKIAALLTQQGQPVPGPATGLALIDTGATLTCVHEPVLQTLGLNPVGTATTGTAQGPAEQYLYPVTIGCPSQKWTFSVEKALGVDLSAQRAPVDPPQDIVVLIGRNLLRHWLLVWNGPGGFWSIGI